MNLYPYEKLEIWKKSILLVERVYALTKAFPKEELFGLVSQMQRAAISIPSNIAEGSARKTKKDFSQFLSIALGSLMELETQLHIADRLQYVSRQTLDASLVETLSLKKMIYVFSQRLAG